LQQANVILHKASMYLAMAELDSRPREPTEPRNTGIPNAR
jgi:hypothetical protein